MDGCVSLVGYRHLSKFSTCNSSYESALTKVFSSDPWLNPWLSSGFAQPPSRKFFKQHQPTTGCNWTKLASVNAMWVPLYKLVLQIYVGAMNLVSFLAFHVCIDKKWPPKQPNDHIRRFPLQNSCFGCQPSGVFIYATFELLGDGFSWILPWTPEYSNTQTAPRMLGKDLFFWGHNRFVWSVILIQEDEFW